MSELTVTAPVGQRRVIAEVTPTPPISTEPTIRKMDLRARLLTVRSVEQISPSMRRITFAPDRTCEPLRLVPLAVGDHIKLILPDESTGEVRLPDVSSDRPIWAPSRDVGDDEGSIAERPRMRDYTLALGTGDDAVVLEMLAHDVGPAGRWASRAEVGSVVGALGPRGSVQQPQGFAHYVCVGDLTAWPALQRWWHEAPVEARLDLVVHVADNSDILALPLRAGSRVTWLVGSSPTLIHDHLHTLGAPALVRDTDLFVWAAGEASAMQHVRRHVLNEWGMARSCVHIDGYWRAGTADHDHHAPLDTEAPEDI